MFFLKNKGVLLSNSRVYWYKHLFVDVFSKTGAHIGHSFQNSIRQAAWMIYGFKWDLAIIDLSFTVSSLKSSFILASLCVSKFRPFWFATQDKTFYRYSRYLATKCGEFSSTLYWIRGMASNFESITFSYFIRRPKYVFMRKDFLFDLNYNDWFFTRLSWPGGLLLSSVFFSYFACRDALKGRIGCIGLLDTNADSKNCLLAVPSNDDSIDWLVFINDVFSEYILVKKLWMILRWNYFLIKKSDNFFVFENWLSNFLGKDIVFNKMLFSKTFNNYNIFYFPIWYISNLNSSYNKVMEKLNVDYNNINVSFSKKVLYNFFQNLLIKKKLILIFSSVSFYGRSFFFSDDIFHTGLSFSNLEMLTPFRFKYIYNSNWKLKHKFKSFSKRILKNNSFFISYITNISFLLTYGVRFLYQRLLFFFSVGYLNNFNWWERFFLSTKLMFFFFNWFFRLKTSILNRALKSKNFYGFFERKSFSFWDPLSNVNRKSIKRNVHFFFMKNDVYGQIKDIKCYTRYTNNNNNVFFYYKTKIYI